MPVERFDAGRSHTRRIAEQTVDQHPHSQTRGVPAAGDQAAVGRLFGVFRVDMKTLGIEAEGEFEDFLLADAALPEVDCLPYREIFKVTICHLALS